ncbi:hypothetical protein PHJA_000848800 [Phtheirospermum japonicum]|uniref:Glycosyltransferase 61 catalytic domain-containing protein n=1 Tax=Phtheirospermum japonicum TaxID=374723 RepID=A0A830BHJ6_9LAMI|nr:hypothetical protein PHJA_000848800 [Phtheirospermum japonicum]
MNNPSSEQYIISNTSTSQNSPPKPYQFPRNDKLPIYLLSISILLLVLYQFHSLQTQQILTNSPGNGREDPKAAAKLRQAVTFLPLKDLRYSKTATEGHTWFMSSLNDTHEEGQAQYQRFPSEPSGGRVLCLSGRDPHDGSWNLYGLAWPDTLPESATLLKDVAFVSYNHYDYDNIWHGLSATMPFVAWHIKSQCGARARPKRWVLYHWGELRTSMAPWVRTILEATFGGGPLEIETMDGYDDAHPVCFEEAVVMRHNEGGLSNEKRMEVYDLMRCKSRMYCNVNSSSSPGFRIGMTLLMREGARSFKNASAVIRIFENECNKVEGCRLTVAYSHNLTFCEQVKLMSLTDILITAHGAQLTNMIFMDRNSSVMELFPKGFLEHAGVGQYVYHWLASWSGMRHEGVWRDPVGDHCPFPEDDPRCMAVFKNNRVGHNETYFSEWAGNVLSSTRMRNKAMNTSRNNPVSGLCGCS